MAYTGQSHFSSQTHDRVWDRFRSNDPDVLDALGTIKDLAREAATALAHADWLALAAVIDENWRHQQRLDATISSPRVRDVETSDPSASR